MAAAVLPGGAARANFELRLYEGQPRFDVIYGTVSNGNTSATAGVQRDDACFTQYFCNGSGGPATGGWALVPAGTPAQLQRQLPASPTATTPTPTATATALRQQPLRLHLQLLTHLHQLQQLLTRPHRRQRLLQRLQRRQRLRQQLQLQLRLQLTPHRANAYGNAHADSETHAAAKRYRRTKASADSAASAVTGDDELVERVVLALKERGRVNPQVAITCPSPSTRRGSHGSFTLNALGNITAASPPDIRVFGD